ncbi:hypothetical protein TNCT_317071 [Trichonephila clavata]|uniref:Uncharacterized protein n=1 Tax=Trichonephila clavata TaxID=2740835 RepID=A0A8X6L2J8_TRICU|nr:hypothetical protein TNCT_317071 [Trichonephila clavata]
MTKSSEGLAVAFARAFSIIISVTKPKFSNRTGTQVSPTVPEEDARRSIGIRIFTSGIGTKKRIVKSGVPRATVPY